jgi:hypothetical protein
MLEISGRPAGTSRAPGLFLKSLTHKSDPGYHGLASLRESNLTLAIMSQVRALSMKFLEHACHAATEGIVSKHAGAPCRPGRSADWLKTKCTLRQEFVIGGWRRSTASGRELGSLMVGYSRAELSDGREKPAGNDARRP